METIETKDTLEIRNDKKISIPILVAGILLFIYLAIYAVYLIKVLPDAIKNQLIDWSFSVTAVDFLVATAMLVLTILAVFKTSRIKYLTIPLMLLGALNIYRIVSVAIENTITIEDTYYVFSFVTLALAYILFGIYTIRKSIVIVFASIFVTLASGFSLWFNIEQLIIYIKASASTIYIYQTLVLIFLKLGISVLIWSCCALLPPKSKDKDVVKKNIALRIVLSIITLGVYAVFWVKSISEDIAKLENKQVNSSLETAMFFIVPFYAIYWLYKNGKRLAKIANDADMSVLYAVQGFFLLCFFSLALMQNQLHMAIELNE